MGLFSTVAVALFASYHPPPADYVFVPDTERWVTPWLDQVLARPVVDPERLALLGISLGGYWVTRAAAHDDRAIGLKKGRIR